MLFKGKLSKEVFTCNHSSMLHALMVLLTQIKKKKRCGKQPMTGKVCVPIDVTVAYLM